jgi:hypothetical protein
MTTYCSVSYKLYSNFIWQLQLTWPIKIMRWWWDLLCTRPTRLVGLFFIVLAHWNNNPLIDMSPHSDTLFWFWAIQSLFFLLNAAFLAEKQQIPILYSFVWQDRSSYPQSITLEAVGLLQYSKSVWTKVGTLTFYIDIK